MALKTQATFGPAPFSKVAMDLQEKSLAEENQKNQEKQEVKVDRMAKARQALAEKRAQGLVKRKSKKDNK